MMTFVVERNNNLLLTPAAANPGPAAQPPFTSISYGLYWKAGYRAGDAAKPRRAHYYAVEERSPWAESRPWRRKTTASTSRCCALAERQPAPETGAAPTSEGAEPPSTHRRPTTKCSRSALLAKVWHLPDGFHWMEPLPYFHRRWALIFGAILLLALLWPYSPERQPFPVSQQETSAAAGRAANGATPANEPTPAGNWQRYYPARPDPRSCFATTICR
ncbi:hypothetical protein M8494_36955 [Serratia ureilytica]